MLLEFLQEILLDKKKNKKKKNMFTGSRQWPNHGVSKRTQWPARNNYCIR